MDLFINAAWTAANKVPKKTAFGVDLVWGDNAFATLAEAKAAGKPSPVYHDFDKNVILDNSALSLKDVRSQEIKSTLDENPAKLTFSAKSKIAPSGSITVSNSDVYGMTVTGFKDVTLKNGGLKAIEVRGGNNTVVHTDTEKIATGSYTKKNVATLNGKAEGTLLLSGTSVSSAYGAWAKATGMYAFNYDIGTGVAEFVPCDPGNPADSAWGATLKTNVLTSAPGYATVTLAGGGVSAGVLQGGKVDYSRTTEGTYRSNDNAILALNKTLVWNTTAAGTLTVDGGNKVNQAYRYANVVFKGDPSGTEFNLLQGGNAAQVRKTTYKYTPSTMGDGIKKTSEGSVTRTAAGAVSIDYLKIKNGSFNRDITGYAKITIVSACYLGDVDATNYKENVKSSYEVVNSGTPNEKVTSSHSSSQQYTAGGTLTNGNSGFGATFSSIQGFNNVNLAVAHVSFGMAAVAAGGAPASNGSTFSETWSNGVLTQSKTTYKTSTAAAGTAVVREWSDIRGGITGFQTVKFTDSTTVSGPVSAGKAEYEETQSYGRTDKNGVATHKYDERYKGSYNALGTLTMNGGKLVNAALMSFATVTLDGVAGVVNEANALGSSGDTRTASTYIGVISSAEESSTAQVVSGVGTLTIANGGALVVSSIYGYNKIAVTSAKVNADITSGRAWKFTASEKTSSDGKADIQKYSLASATSSTVAGSVVLTGVTMAGGISGYKTLTLDDTAVAGNIGGIDTVESDSVNKEYTDDWVTTLKFSQSYASSATPNIALTLKNGATVGGYADGVKTLNLGVSAEIGNVNMAGESVRSNHVNTYDNKKYIYSMTDYSSSVSAGYGTVTLAADAVAGTIIGAAKVSATSATLGDLYYSSRCEEAKNSSYDSAGNVTNWYNYNMTSTMAATATLTSTTAGTLVGYGNAKVTACIINGAYVGSEKNSTYEMSSTQVYSSSGNGAYTPVGAFTGQGGTVFGVISGYQTVSLDGTYVNGNIAASSWKTVENLKIAYDSYGNRIGQSYTNEYSDSPTATLTLKNNAGTYFNVSGFKTVNLATNAWVDSNVCMSSYSTKEINNITSNQKTNLFEWNYQSGFSYGAPGTFTATGNAYIDKMIYGAAKVTLTDADAYSDVACDNTFESSSIVAKGEQLTAEVAGSAVELDSKYATEWNERDIYGYFASGAFTLTRGMAKIVSGFTTVKLTSASIESAVADNSKRTLSHTFKNGTDLMTEVYSSGVAGTLTATDTTFAIGGMAISGYATVNLTRCWGYGQIYGGIEESFGSGSGNAAYFSAAKIKAEADFTSATTYRNGGKLTAVDTTTGDICHFSTVDLKNCFAGDIYAQDTDKSTVTFSGDNYLGSLYYCTTVTVKNGETEVNKCIGTDGSDSVTVNAGTTLTIGGDWNFAGGDDKATINGIVRLLGNLNNSDKLALTGSGIIAVTNANFNKITYDWAFGNLGELTGNGIYMLVNAGTTEGTVRAVRTQKEELADNTAKSARKLEGDDMDGWLSGEESLPSGKFADTEDWFKFKYQAGVDYYADLEVNGRNGDLTVELYRGGTKIQDVAWNNYSKTFDIDETGLAAGTEYQLRLALREDAANKTALAYAFHKA